MAGIGHQGMTREQSRSCGPGSTPAVGGAGRSWEPGGSTGALVARHMPCLPPHPSSRVQPTDPQTGPQTGWKATFY